MFKLVISGLCSLLIASAAWAQDANPDTQKIIETLGAKKPATRSLGAAGAGNNQDTEFLRNLPTRSLGTRGLEIQQREELVKVVERQKLPAIDIQINFELNSATLTPQATQALNQLGQALLSPALAGSKIALNGHTDATGTDAHNQTLSEARAFAVRDYLTNTFGAKADNMVVAGFGESRLKDAHDPEGAVNRRVEVINLGTYTAASN